MCLILFASRWRPDVPLVLLANRDEYYARPAAPASRWPDAPDILAGRDLQAGGTWLGVNTRDGRIAAVTNFRDGSRPARTNAPSRGALAVDFLSGADSAPAYARRLVRQAPRYQEFSLLFGTMGSELWYFCSRLGTIQPVTDGIHGLSNAALDMPWPKVASGRAHLGTALESGARDDETLLNILSDRAVPSDTALPDTGIGVALERQLAPRFITTPTYGTRCSTLILLTAAGQVRFAERRYPPDVPTMQTQVFRFELGAPTN